MSIIFTLCVFTFLNKNKFCQSVCLPTCSFESFASISCVQGVSDKIQRVLNEVGVKVAMKPHLTIRKLVPSLKDPIDNNENLVWFTKFRAVTAVLYTLTQGRSQKNN